MRRAIAIVLVLVMLLPAEARTPVAGVEIPITDIESLMVGQPAKTDIESFRHP